MGWNSPGLPAENRPAAIESITIFSSGLAW